MKLWSELAHNQNTDAKRVLEKVESRSDATATSTVIAAVERVPDAVVEKMRESGSVVVALSLSEEPPR